MIEVDKVTKYYGDFPAITDVSFHVGKGEIVGFLGPNGAGKTTAMRIITGFMPASAGTVRVGGYDILEQSLDVRKRIGYLPETVPLYTDMSVRAYLGFFANLRGVKKDSIPNRVDDVIERLNLQEYADSLIGKLSKGYRQRVGIAQAIVHNPEVLVLDEPTVGLDPKQVVETRAFIKELGKSHTIILSSHILPEVSMICQRVVIIDEGRVIAEDRPDSLTAKLGGTQRIELDVRGPAQEVLSRISKLDAVLHVNHSGDGDRGRYIVECRLGKDIREDLAALVVRSGWGLLELKSSVMSLEEIFLKLTTKEEAA